MKKSILQALEPKQCFLCGRQFNIQVHHIYSGVANRKISDKNGFWVYLCASCHTGNGGAQYEKELNLKLKQICQQKFEETHSREEFRSLIGKSYL